MKTYNFINIFKYISLIFKKMPSYLKKTLNKNKLPRKKNRSMASPPMKRKAKKKLAETGKGSYYNQCDKNVLR